MSNRTSPRSPPRSPKKKRRQSKTKWAQAAPPKTTWSSTLSNAIRNALALADEVR